MTIQSLELMTVLFLVGFFLYVEIRQWVGRRQGVIVGVIGSPLPLANLLGSEVRVRMDDGELITAVVPACTQCMGRLRVGDDVHVVSTGDGYSVKLPFGIRRLSRGAESTAREDMR